MPVYDWRRRRTEYFGEVSIPFARIEIQTAGAQYQAFALQIDSGAVVSLLRRSAGELLGVDVESGRRVESSSIGAYPTAAYVHELVTRFDDSIVCPVPFAIAENEAVPNLLGRLGVFDKLQVDFDASLAETRISAPWLDDTQRRIWKFVIDTDKDILGRWDEVDLPPHVKEVAKRFVRRGAQLLAAAAGLAKLHRAYEGPLVVRSLFELATQFEYLMQSAEERAQQYLDFKHVTRHQQLQSIVKDAKGPFGLGIAESPLRAKGEPSIKAEFQRVRSQFLHRDGKRLWHCWYCMPVRGLAETVGREAEYRLWYAQFSAWAHADPFPAERMSLVDGRTLLLHCYRYYARVLLLVANNLILTAEQHGTLTKLAAEFV